MSLYSIFAVFLILSPNLWVYGMTMWHILGLSLGVLPVVLPLVLLSPWSVVPSWVLPSSQMLFRNLLSTLSNAHLGYLHLDRAFLRCCISLLRGSGPVQTVFALWVRVPMTLYLAARLWWLSDCKYWSVWVGFLYTEIDKELSASGLTKVSRKAIVPISWLPSTVNFIAGSILFMHSRNNYLWASCWMTKVSSTNLNQYQGISFQNTPYTS